MRSGVLVAGYYGAGNTGDEAILAGMLAALKAQGIEDIIVLSRDPDETRLLHGVESINCGCRLKGLYAVYRCLLGRKLFILGGGGLLQDHTARVVPFWLSRVILAMLAGTPVMYYAQGIGPLRTAMAKRLVAVISNRVSRITVRDEESRLLLLNLGVTRVPVEVTADPALGITITSDGVSLLKKAGVTLADGKIKVGVSLRSWEGEKEYLPVLIRALNRLRQHFEIQFIFFPLQYGCDERVCLEVLDGLDSDGDNVVAGRHSPEQVTAMLSQMDAVIAMRLHAVVLSALSNVPSFGLIYDPKVESFMNRAGIGEHSMKLEEVAKNESRLSAMLALWLSERKQISERMQRGINEMVAGTARNARIVGELLDC